MNSNVRTIGLFALFGVGILSVIATGGDDDGQRLVLPPLPPPSPAGIYNGPIAPTNSVQPLVHQVTGIVSELFDAQFFGTESHYAGSVSADGSMLGGTLTRYLGRTHRFFGTDGTQVLTLDGTIDETGLNGSYTAQDDQGSFDLAFSPLYERPSSLDLTAGVWPFSEASAGGGVYALSIAIDDTGAVLGSDSLGCVLSGQLSIIDNQRNAYRATITIELCGQFDGAYEGLAYLSDQLGGENNVLSLSIANAEHALSITFEN